MKNSKVIFKRYDQDQPTFLPQDLEELIPSGHLVRTVNRTIDRLDISPLIEKYKRERHKQLPYYCK